MNTVQVPTGGDNETDGERRRCREQWQVLLREGVTLAALQAFHARYKYLVMSRDIQAYRALGALLATADSRAVDTVAPRLFEGIMQALRRPATRGGNANALLHIGGYFKRQLLPEDKYQLLDTVERYRCGEVGFDEPLALLHEYLCWFPNAYIEQQWFLQPPPALL